MVWDHLGPIGTVLDHSEQDHSVPFETVWERTELFRTLWDRSEQFGTVWNSSGPFTTIRDRSRPFGTVRDNSGPFRTIWECLGPSEPTKTIYLSPWTVETYSGVEDELLTYRYYVREEEEEVERLQAVQKVVDIFIDTMQVWCAI